MDPSAALLILALVPIIAWAEEYGCRVQPHVDPETASLLQLALNDQASQPLRANGQHRFCENGKDVELCTVRHKVWDFSVAQQQANLNTALQAPVDSGRTMCLNLWSLVAQTKKDCENYEKGVALLTSEKFALNLTNYEMVGSNPIALNRSRNALGNPASGIPLVPESFFIMGPWSEPPVNGMHFVADEFQSNNYNIDKLKVNEGDVLLDIGANVGLFSIIAAKSHPGLQLIAFEPQVLNFLLLHHNIAELGIVDRVSAVNRAMTSDGRDILMAFNKINCGGSQAYYEEEALAIHEEGQFIVPSMTFGQAVSTYITNGSLFDTKLDCELCEYEIKADLLANEHRFKNLRGELHPPPPGAEDAHAELLAMFKRKDELFGNICCM